ncbi:hypothetical protein [Bacillus sp. FJAT-52991]|uniref:Uncharacterized protein n=1 Tax=Bacillus kandeliae TaxID=3129297 RepID=A0ABZ2N4K5_9BACI
MKEKQLNIEEMKPSSKEQGLPPKRSIYRRSPFGSQPLFELAFIR